MDICRMCARRTAIMAALCGGLMVAVLGAGACSSGLVWLGGACTTGITSAYALIAG